MCSIGWHNCRECGEEQPCYFPDEACFSDFVCEKCEYWQEEVYREEQRRAEWQAQAKAEWDWLHEEDEDK